jgi:hypothetical protein
MPINRALLSRVAGLVRPLPPGVTDVPGGRQWSQRYTSASTARRAMVAGIFAALAVWRTLALEPGPERIVVVLPVLALWLVLIQVTLMCMRSLSDALALAVLAVFVASVYFTGRMAWRQPDGPALLGVVALWVIALATAHNCLYRSQLRALELTLPPCMRSGSTVPFRLAVTPQGRMSVRRATLLLTAEEWVYPPYSDDKHKDQVHRNEIEICQSLELAADRETTLSGTFAPPEGAPPSMHGRYHGVDWSARLWMNIAGWRPDTVLLLEPGPVVAPAVSDAPEGPADIEPIELRPSELAFCDARLILNVPTDVQGRPRLWPGQSAEGRLQMSQLADRDPFRRVVLEVGFLMSGSEREQAEVAQRATLWEGGSGTDREINVPVSIGLPARGPITYHGRLFSVEWSLTIRVESPTWTSAATIPIVVGRGSGAAG